MKKAARMANMYVEDFLRKRGGEQKLLEDDRYCQMHLYELAIMQICSGEWQKAEAYLQKMRECKLCVICEKWECFEYYFGMGLIAEHKGELKRAKELYEKAIEVKGDYPCAQRHLLCLLNACKQSSSHEDVEMQG